MGLIATVIGLILMAGLIYLACLDGKFHVKRNLEIELPLDTVFTTIIDFKSWPEWNPWLMYEPDAEVTYSDNYQEEGGSYSWSGQVIGAGKLTHVSILPATRVNQQIEFLKPFKSVSLVNWEFENSNDNCLVSWEISGRMPFLFRFMTKQMEIRLDRDCELGLTLLNGVLCPHVPHPNFDFAGIEVLQDFSYWSIPCNGNLRQLETNRGSSIETLRVAAGGSTALALSLYHHFDPLASHFQAEIAIPIGDSPPSSNYTRREFHGGRYFKMILQGDHQFLPMGWHALSSHCRLHKLKPDRKRPALEIYHLDPKDPDESKAKTSSLYLPVK